VYAMRPPALDELGLVPALRQQVASARTADGRPMQVTVAAPELPQLPAAVEVAAYRIATEAVTNSARHSGTDRAWEEPDVVQVGDGGPAVGGQGGHLVLCCGPPGFGVNVGLGGEDDQRPVSQRGQGLCLSSPKAEIRQRAVETLCRLTSTAARLITRYFGTPPKQLMRKYRGVRAASLLVDPNCTPELRAKVESLFYDQPHMIREIRQFAGRTPGALDGDDSRILRMWLSKDNYRDIETFPG